MSYHNLVRMNAAHSFLAIANSSHLLASVVSAPGMDSFYQVLGIFILVFVLVLLIFIVVLVVSMWKIYQKAGKPGWASIVPFYNLAVLLEIVGEPFWWLLIILFVPFVGFVLSIIIANRLAKSFGRSSGFTVGLIFLPFIFYPILAFGKSVYTKTYESEQVTSEAVKWSLIAGVVFFLIEGMFLFAGMLSGKNSEPLKIISGDSGYATDGTYVYHNDVPIEGADPDSFKVKGPYSLDSKSVYYDGTAIADSDPSTFTRIGKIGGYAKDAHAVYYEGVPVEAANSASFGLLKDDKYGSYAKDANAVYDLGVAIAGADPATFVILGDGYSEDSHAVYSQTNNVPPDAIDEVIQGADLKTFVLITDPAGTYDAKDKNYKYSYGQRVN
jgi:hypothetical protein